MKWGDSVPGTTVCGEGRRGSRRRGTGWWEEVAILRMKRGRKEESREGREGID